MKKKRFITIEKQVAQEFRAVQKLTGSRNMAHFNLDLIEENPEGDGFDPVSYTEDFLEKMGQFVDSK